MLIEFVLKAGALLYVIASVLGETANLTTFEDMNIIWLAVIMIWLWAAVSLSLIFILRMLILISRFAKKFLYAD